MDKYGGTAAMVLSIAFDSATTSSAQVLARLSTIVRMRGDQFLMRPFTVATSLNTL